MCLKLNKVQFSNTEMFPFSQCSLLPIGDSVEYTVKIFYFNVYLSK